MTRLLISTLEHVVLWDSHPHIMASGDRAQGNGNYNGITWDGETIYVAGSQDFRYCIHMFDGAFNYKGCLFNDLHQVHQIFWIDGLLYVVNTGKNRVETWDGETWKWTAFNPSAHDIDHLNGMWGVGDRMYISEFRHRPNEPSVVRVCDKELNLLDTWTVGPPIHNVYLEGGKMYNLVSRQFKGILETDLTTMEQTRHEFVDRDNSLVRGLARSADNWFVGLSRWEPERSKRHIGDACVVVFDNDFREVERIVVKDVGPTCDVRLLDEPDFAHNGINSQRLGI